MRRCVLSLDPAALEALAKLVTAVTGLVGGLAAAYVAIRAIRNDKRRNDDPESDRKL